MSTKYALFTFEYLQNDIIIHKNNYHIGEFKSNKLTIKNIYCNSLSFLYKELDYNKVIIYNKKEFSIDINIDTKNIEYLYIGKFISKQLKEELIEKSSIPPNIHSLPIFKKGGVFYWETWNEINEMNS